MTTPDSVLHEVVDFFKSPAFACSPFRAFLKHQERPEKFISVLPEAVESRQIEMLNKIMPFLHSDDIITRAVPATVFVHPTKPTSKVEDEELAEQLNMEVAGLIRELLCFPEGSSDPQTLKVDLDIEKAVLNGKYDLVRNSGPKNDEGFPELFSTYMTPALPMLDSRFAPYPLIAVVRISVVTEIADKVQADIVMSAMIRNGMRGFTGAYYPIQGVALSSTTDHPEAPPQTLPSQSES